MTFTPAAVQVPGIDLASMLRGATLVFPALFLFGPVAAPILLFGLIFIKKLTMWRTRLIGPPLMNQALLDERGRGMLVLVGIIGGGFLAYASLNRIFPGNWQRSAAIAFLLVLVVLVWFRPSMAVLPVLGITAVGGSSMLLAAVPIVIMLARRDQRCRLKMPRTLRRTAMTLLYALAGFLATLLFANASAGAPPTDSEGREAPASPTGEDSWLDQFSSWLFQRGDGVDTSTPSRLVQVPGQPQTGTTPPDSTPWLLWLALALGAVALVAAVIWFRRRRQRSGTVQHDPNAALTLARLEAIGATVGRRRAANEGALTFASKLAQHTGDSRLDEAGPLVSGDVYATNAVEPQLVQSQLTAVESDPPPPPPIPPRIQRIVGRVRSLPVSRRGVFVSLASLAGLGALVWFAAPKLGDLREPTDRELAYVEQADAPDEWHALMGTPDADLIAWQTCSSSGYEGESLYWTTAGLSHRTEALGAEVSANGSHTGLIRGHLVVGTDRMTASTAVEDGSIVDEPWRISEWVSVAIQPFSTVDAVLAATTVRDPILTEYVDRNGDVFSRYESLPPEWEAVYGDDAPLSPISLDSAERMRVVDIWTDDLGLPVRVRIIGDGPDGQWLEWRRLIGSEFSGSDTRLALPTCEPDKPWANNNWIGSEPWTPSRSVPVQIEFDDDGNPYDLYSWDSGDITVEPSGTLPGPISVLSIGDLTSISPSTDDEDQIESDYEHEQTYELDWETGADITLLRVDEWPAATRINIPGEQVVAWDEFEPFYAYESFVTLVASSNFPVVDHDDLDVILEPLWDGDAQVSADVDGKPGDELTVLTQSDTTGRVVGRNDAGDIVSIIIWGDWIEWRAFGFEGTPPPSVLERENDLRACLAGDREVDLTGRCSWSD